MYEFVYVTACDGICLCEWIVCACMYVCSCLLGCVVVACVYVCDYVVLSIIWMWLPLYVLVCLLPEMDINNKYTIVSFSPSILNKISQNIILTIIFYVDLFYFNHKNHSLYSFNCNIIILMTASILNTPTISLNPRFFLKLPCIPAATLAVIFYLSSMWLGLFGNEINNLYTVLTASTYCYIVSVVKKGE